MCKERPILFNGDMVNAILDGRKTQTRRVLKSQPDVHVDHFRHVTTCAKTGRMEWQACNKANQPVYAFQKKPCFVTEIAQFPYGQPGDRLWVRETFQGPLVDQEEMEKDPTWIKDMSRYENPEHCAYRASGDSCEFFDAAIEETVQRWKPSIHMPRWASRIMLEIVSVRVERLQDISEADAMAEGCQAVEGCRWRTFAEAEAGIPMHQHTAKDAFSALWERINGPDSWDANPWVWVIEFKRAQARKMVGGGL